MAKLYQDINNHPATRCFVAAFLSTILIGGETKNNPFQFVHNLVFHSLNATSFKTFEYFAQLHVKKQFTAFDYGPVKNLEIYGSKEPLNFMENYNKYVFNLF